MLMEEVFVYDFAINIKSPITKIYTSHRNGKIIASPMRPIKTKSAPKYFILIQPTLSFSSDIEWSYIDYINYIYRFIVFVKGIFGLRRSEIATPHEMRLAMTEERQ
ncbi:MAG: hypothetical protein WAN57_03480 [Smithella sp.]